MVRPRRQPVTASSSAYSGSVRSRPPVAHLWIGTPSVLSLDGLAARLTAVLVSPALTEDRPALEAFLHGHNALRAARRGELVRPADHPALLAWSGGELVG